MPIDVQGAMRHEAHEQFAKGKKMGERNPSVSEMVMQDDHDPRFCKWCEDTQWSPREMHEIRQRQEDRERAAIQREMRDEGDLQDFAEFWNHQHPPKRPVPGWLIAVRIIAAIVIVYALLTGALVLIGD